MRFAGKFKFYSVVAKFYADTFINVILCLNLVRLAVAVCIRIIRPILARAIDFV